MEDDIDLALSPENTAARQAPKQGRRAKQDAFSSDAKQTANDDIGLASPLKAKPMADVSLTKHAIVKKGNLRKFHVD
jgi:hypothetical protein